MILIMASTSIVVLLMVTTLAGGLSIVPDILTYKTCVNSPPGFSPGCMDNVTVNPGGKATFNCQVDPRCHIQFLYWYHETPLGERRLLKTGRNATEPYMHTIRSAYRQHEGRYFCIIGNVMGESECSAFLIIRSSAVLSAKSSLMLTAAIILLWTSSTIS